MGARSVRPGWPSMTEKDISDPKQAGMTGGIKLHHYSEICFPSTDHIMRETFCRAALGAFIVFCCADYLDTRNLNRSPLLTL